MLQNIDAETQPVLDVLSGGSSKELRLPKESWKQSENVTFQRQKEYSDEKEAVQLKAIQRLPKVGD